MVRLNSCCCGCSLQTGSVLIGVWGTLSSLLVLGVGIWGAEEIKERRSESAGTIRSMMITYACIGALSASFAIMLVIGAVNKIPSLLKAWVVFQIVCLVLAFIGLIMLIFSGAAVNNFIGIALNIALTIYFILVVDSYHKDLTTTHDPSLPREPTQAGYHPASVNTV